MANAPRSFVIAAFVLCASAESVSAQIIPGWEVRGFTQEQIDADRVRVAREVEIRGVGPNEGMEIFADDLQWNIRTGEFEASGNVLVVSKTGRIAAERVVFNTKTRLGTFHTASGLASLGERGVKDKSMFGTLEPDVMFYGERIDKIGDDRYKISDGGFTTCVQPTPRWEVVSGSITIDLEDYAILRNAVIRVKDVPVFYLPVLYYPIQSDDRATGFLLPTYGNSTYRGHSISNAFFWAIDRSQDATFFHDWLLTRGQGFGAEYRYMLSPGSEGQVRAYRLNERTASVQLGSSTVTTPARRSFEIRGGVSQNLAPGLQARARADYFSDVTVRQLYQNNWFDAANSNRNWGATITGSWQGVTVNGDYQRSEYFYSPTSYVVNGTSPSLTAALTSRQIARLPLFASVQSEAAHVIYRTVSGATIDDQSLWRGDLTPSVRAALSTLPFLRVNGTVTWRYTRFSESLDSSGAQVSEGVTRKYFDLRSDVTGPILTRVFGDTGTRIKHVAEPQFSINRVTEIPDLERIPVSGNTYNYFIGGFTRLTYGFTNRFLIRPAADPNAETQSPTAPREFLIVGLQQSYYTDQSASTYDPTYSLSYLFREPRRFSPWMLSVRAAPTNTTSIDARVEYDTTASQNKLQGITLNGTVNTRFVQASGGWSQRRFAVGDIVTPDSYIQASSTLKTSDGSVGGTYAFNYDIRRSNLLQQRWIGFYNAQCCGILVEYQEYNFPGSDPRFLIPKDRRFNLSFSLAGIGSFSNFFGVFGGSTMGGTRGGGY